MSYSARLQQRKSELEAAIVNSSFTEYAAVLQAMGGATAPGGGGGAIEAGWTQDGEEWM